MRSENSTRMQSMPRMKIVYPKEDAEQIRLAIWLTQQGIRFTASANGAKRSLPYALKLKRMGLSPGFPDIEIPFPSGSYHGLYIELKREKGGRPSDSQKGWIDYLNEKGYFATFAYGFDEAKEIVLHYLSFNQKEGML